MVKTREKRLLRIITCMSFLVMICMDVLTIVSVLENGAIIQKSIPQTLRLWTWLFYFTLAHSILKLKNSNQIIKGIKRKKWFIIPAMFLLNVGYEYYIGFRVLNICLPEFFYDNLLMVITVAVLFLGLYELDIRNERIRIVIKELSADILGIYIIHLHVKELLLKIIVVNTITKQIAFLMIIFIVSTVIISMVRRMPVINKLVT